MDSYLSNLRRVEQLLGADLDVFVSDDTSIDYARARLHDAGLKHARVSDCLSAVRAYAAFRREAAGADLSPRETIQAEPFDSATRFRTLEQTSTADLLSDYAAILHELRARGVARTGNGPVGDYAEHLFARAMSWTLEPNSNAGFDARDPAAGTRVEIKARRLTSSKRVAQLGAMRGLPERRFDLLAVLLFAPDFSVDTAILVPHAVVLRHATYAKHTNSWRLLVNLTLLAQPGVKDVTRRIAAASADDSINT